MLKKFLFSIIFLSFLFSPALFAEEEDFFSSGTSDQQVENEASTSPSAPAVSNEEANVYADAEKQFAEEQAHLQPHGPNSNTASQTPENPLGKQQLAEQKNLKSYQLSESSREEN